MKTELLDSSLRDGMQGENINYSTEDKIKILTALDRFGIDFIEAGNPSSNPKDVEFFYKALTIPLKNAKLVSFGATRRKLMKCEDDPGLAAILKSGTEYVTIFGKASLFHVTEIINTEPDENLRMIFETVEFLVKNNKKVFFDAEHFFDGYKANPEYALAALIAAESAGASRLILCDTNGGTFPFEAEDIIKTVLTRVKIPVGVHFHNDCDCAVANSISAVKAGASHVQGTFIGIGERCGNTNLACLLPTLQCKFGYECVPSGNLTKLTETARLVAEISNIKLRSDMPYVGQSAFSHKGGMHVDGVCKNPASFEHIPPETVGNKRNILLSEVAGRAAVLARIAEFAPFLPMSKDNPDVIRILEKLKSREKDGYQFEAAEASFALLVKRELNLLPEFFHIDYFKIISEPAGNNPSTAIVKVKAGGMSELTVSEGNGPVNAIDKALRKALSVLYPELKKVRLSDFKVRIIDSTDATGAVTRVLIESTDGNDIWTTVGASPDIINASVIALTDSMLYKLSQ